MPWSDTTLVLSSRMSSGTCRCSIGFNDEMLGFLVSLAQVMAVIRCSTPCYISRGKSKLGAHALYQLS